MTTSDLLPSHGSHTEAACSSNLGTYYLPKTYIKVVIEQVTYRFTDGDKGISRRFNEIKELKEVRKPDRTQGYCFDYRASPTAKEKVDVVRTKEFLFNYVSTESLDQSAYILKTLVRALFIGLSGNKDFQPFRGDRTEGATPDKHIVFDAEYDPFDVKQSAMINDALTAFHLCLVLENHTFDPRQHAIDSYCNNPKGVVRHEKRSAGSALPHVRKEARGIVYRPRLPYNLYAFVPAKSSKGHHRTWAMASSEIVHLENEAPNLVIGIERSFFANRRATLMFDEGALKNVCIHKTSELEQLSSVPLEIAGSIAALPTNILQVRIENTTNHRNLVAAEHELLKTQVQHLKFLKDPTAANVPAVPTKFQRKDAASSGPEATKSWVTLPNGRESLPAGAPLSQSDWEDKTWNICPALTKAKDDLLPAFTDAISGAAAN